MRQQQIFPAGLRARAPAARRSQTYIIVMSLGDVVRVVKVARRPERGINKRGVGELCDKSQEKVEGPTDRQTGLWA